MSQRKWHRINRREAERLWSLLDGRVRQLGMYAGHPPAEPWEVEARDRLGRELGKEQDR